MAVTELCLLSIIDPETMSTETFYSILRKLEHARQVMESWTGRHFYIMRQDEDPRCFYVVGEWDSVAQHMEEWIPSAENQELLDSLKGLIKVEWLIHLDMPQSSCIPLLTPSVFPPLDKMVAEKQKAIDEKLDYVPKDYGGMFYTIIRHAQNTTLFKDLNEATRCFSGWVTGGKTGRGWVMDSPSSEQEQGREFVLFLPWTDYQPDLHRPEPGVVGSDQWDCIEKYFGEQGHGRGNIRTAYVTLPREEKAEYPVVMRRKPGARGLAITRTHGEIMGRAEKDHGGG